VKLRFFRAASPPIRDLNQLVHHVRDELARSTSLDPAHTILPDPSNPRSQLLLQLDGAHLQTDRLLAVDADNPATIDSSQVSLHLESIRLAPSCITAVAPDQTQTSLSAHAEIAAPVLTLRGDAERTSGGEITHFRSANLEIDLEPTFDKFLASLLPELIQRKTGVAVSDLSVQISPVTDGLSVHLVASVKAFVMSATVRISATVVRTNEHLFLKDLSATTDASMLAGLLNGYVKSFAESLSDRPLPLAFANVPMRCTSLQTSHSQGVHVRFEAP
jgi:hypothetical protein